MGDEDIFRYYSHDGGGNREASVQHGRYRVPGRFLSVDREKQRLARLSPRPEAGRLRRGNRAPTARVPPAPQNPPAASWRQSLLAEARRCGNTQTPRAPAASGSTVPPPPPAPWARNTGQPPR